MIETDGQVNLFFEVVPVAVYDRIYHRLTNGHTDLVQIFLFETALLRDTEHQILGGVDALQGGVHSHFHTSSVAALIIWHIVHEKAAQ